MNRPGRWALVGGLVAMIVALALFDPYLFTGGDNATYYALAKALAEGHGYVDLIAPGAHPETLYPPGYPAYLVPFYLMFGGSIIGLKLASLLAGLVLLAAIWGMARSDTAVPSWAGAAAIWLVGLSTVFLTYSHLVLSDMAFTAAAFLSLWLFTRATHFERDRGGVGIQWLAALLVGLVAFYIRTAGVAVLAAGIGWALWRRRWPKLASASAATIAGALPWLWWTARRPPQTGGYLQQLQASDRLDPSSPVVPAIELVERVATNVIHYASFELPQIAWPFPPPAAVRAVGTVSLLVLFAVGAWNLWRRGGVQVWHLYLASSIVMLVVWPWFGDRFFLAIVPAVWLCILAGLDRLGRPARAAWLAPAIAAIIAGVLLAGALRTIPVQWRYTRAYLDGDLWVGYDGFWQDYFRAARWIAEDDPQAIILARKPTLAWYWSRRKSVVYPFHGDTDATWRFVRENGVTHVLAEPLTQAFLGAMIAEHADDLDLVYSGPYRDVFVLRVAPAE